MGNVVWEVAGKTLNNDLNFSEYGGQLLIGVNIVYNNKVALRLGRNKVGSTTAGIGLSWKNMSLDYAFLNEPAGSGLGVSHLVSITVNSEWISAYIEKL